MEWSDDIEKVLESIRENSLVMRKHHTKNYLSFKSTLKYYKIPVIVISAFNSVLSVGAEKYINQQYLSGITCLLSLLCGIIGSIELYLKLQENCENELIASKDFYSLAINIYKMLSLQRNHRDTDGKVFLEDCYKQYLSIYERANVMKKKYDDALFHTPVLSENPQLRLSIPNINSNGGISDTSSEENP
tara:strand:- start:319 stop:885 length:567 start_codon:yes stop_codon:yes gene_type:complete